MSERFLMMEMTAEVPVRMGRIGIMVNSFVKVLILLSGMFSLTYGIKQRACQDGY